VSSLFSFLFLSSISPGRSKSILVQKDLPLDVDSGFLTVTDPNTIDKESYECAFPPLPLLSSISLILPLD
jgi:hypothetical protein